MGGRRRAGCPPSRRPLRETCCSAARRRTRRRCDAFARYCVTGAEVAQVSRPVRLESHGWGDPCRAEGGRSRRTRRAERARLSEGATGAGEKFCGRAGKILGRRAALQSPREIPERGLKPRATTAGADGFAGADRRLQGFRGSGSRPAREQCARPSAFPCSIFPRRYTPAPLGPPSAEFPGAGGCAVAVSPLPDRGRSPGLRAGGGGEEGVSPMRVRSRAVSGGGGLVEGGRASGPADPRDRDVGSVGKKRAGGRGRHAAGVPPADQGHPAAYSI